MIRVVVGASTFAEAGDAALKMLEDKGIEVVKNPYRRKMTEDEIIAHLRNADGLLAGLEPINEKVLSNAPSLKAVARIGIGMDSVDLDACDRHGVKVSNTPDAPTEAVAEMTVAALLSIARQIVPCNQDLHKGTWKKRLGFSVKGKKVLIIGYGRIGRKVGELLSGLGAVVVPYDPYCKDIPESDLDELIGDADIMTLHAAGKEPILTEARMHHMKAGVVVLNSARGSLIDEPALADALESGRIAWYWGDVFQNEPYEGRLADFENAILTPHVSSNTAECRLSMEMEAAMNIIRDLGL